jgi:hypothetical protein
VESQSVLTQTLYAQLRDEALSYALSIFENGMAGSPYVATIKGRAYIYWQVPMPQGGTKSRYLGADNPETQTLVERLRTRKQATDGALSALSATTRVYLSSGGAEIEPAHFKIMDWLARHGLFSKGLVVVGSHAFASIGNALGVRWGTSSRTTDMDFARPDGIQLAIMGNRETINVPEIVKARDPSFSEICGLDIREPSTSLLSRKTRVRIDFLTNKTHWSDNKPRFFADLGITAEPLEHMDYLIGKTFPGLLIGRTHAIPVMLPDPAHFAVHKLIIRRANGFEQKTKKDILQATEIIAALRENGGESDLLEAVRALPQGGKNRLHRVLPAIPDEDARKIIENILGAPESTGEPEDVFPGF